MSISLDLNTLLSIETYNLSHLFSPLFDLILNQKATKELLNLYIKKGASLTDYFIHRGKQMYPVTLAMYFNLDLEVVDLLWIPINISIYKDHITSINVPNRELYIKYLFSKKYKEVIFLEKKPFSFEKLDYDLNLNNDFLSNFFKCYLSKNTNDFLDYLDKNGNYYNLVKLFIELETYFDLEIAPLFIFTKFYDQKLWEIPSTELCTGLLKLLKFMNITVVDEICCGTGLLTARLKRLDSNLQITAYDPVAESNNSNFFFSKPLFYTNVEYGTIEKYLQKNCILVSWIHYEFMESFLELIIRNNTKIVISIGQDAHKNSVNITPYFDKIMKDLGFKKILIQFKQIAQIDYYLFDSIRQPKTHRSHTIIYTKTEFNFTKFLEDNSDLLGKPLDYQLFDKYNSQDTKYFIIAEKKIADVLKNNNKSDLICKTYWNYLQDIIKIQDNGKRKYLQNLN